MDQFLGDNEDENKNGENIDPNPSQLLPSTSYPKRVNFQKASCTLDASIKIYSHRVDDIWTSSKRVLDNLTRSKGGCVEEEEEEEGEEMGDKKKRRKKQQTIKTNFPQPPHLLISYTH